MNRPIRTKIVKIGNSHGIRIPKALLKQADLENEVEMTLEGDKLIIQFIQSPRHDWEAQFAKMAEQGDDRLLDEIEPTAWEESEWEWE